MVLTSIFPGARSELTLIRSASEDADVCQIVMAPQLDTTDPIIWHIVQLLKAEVEQGESGSRLYVESAMTMLGIHLLRHYSNRPAIANSPNSKLSKATLKRIVNYIEANLSENLTLAGLARVAGLSPHHFSRCFRESIGIPPHQYVLKLRLERAKHLLASPQQSVAQVAYETGFSSQSHFSTAFRRAVGVTPQAYRIQL